MPCKFSRHPSPTLLLPNLFTSHRNISNTSPELLPKSTFPHPYKREDARTTEEILIQQHRVLLRHLTQSFGNAKIIPRSDRATRTLTRLTNAQFLELSADTCDELLRRQGALEHAHVKKSTLYSIYRGNFNPLRNSAREKIAALSATRFRDLVVDVILDLERRFMDLPSRRIEEIREHYH